MECRENTNYPERGGGHGLHQRGFHEGRGGGPWRRLAQRVEDARPSAQTARGGGGRVPSPTRPGGPGPAPPRMQAARPASAGGVSSDLAAASTVVCPSTPARRGSVRNTGRARSGLVEGFPKAVLSSHKNGVVSEA